MLPEEIKDGLDNYALHGTPTGGFLRAVLANDLMGAVERADDNNIYNLGAICKYIYNHMPSTCHGSYKIVDKWSAAKRCN